MTTTLLDPREHDTSRDAGLYRRASIGDLVWEDADGDGIQDPEEPGIAGVTVHLLDGAGNRVASTLTDRDGIYGFEDLTPGTYRIEIEFPDGYAASPADRGPGEDDDDAFDSDIDAEGVTEPFVLRSHREDVDHDAGLHPAAWIGDLVWEDLDGDGIQDPDEPGLSGVTVRLLDASDATVASTVTGAGGAYAFADLAAGKYRVVVVIPEGYTASPRNRGSDDAADSDIDAEGSMARVTLAPGQRDRRWDAGLVPAVT